MTRRTGLLAAAAALVGCDRTPGQAQSFASIDISGAPYAQGFNLTDHNGQRRSLKDFAGKAVVVFFGFVQCPDVCPTTMVQLAEVKKLLGERGSRLQAIFITVDPERDTPTVLKAYMANFDPTFLALVPSAQELEPLAKDFKVFYKKVPGSTPTSYTMDHTANGYVFDAQGRIRLVARHGMPAQDLAKDIGKLL